MFFNEQAKTKSDFMSSLRVTSSFQQLPVEILPQVIDFLDWPYNIGIISKDFLRLVNLRKGKFFKEIDKLYSTTTSKEHPHSKVRKPYLLFSFFLDITNLDNAQKVTQIFQQIWSHLNTPAAYRLINFSTIIQYEELLKSGRLVLWRKLPKGEEYLRKNRSILALSGIQVGCLLRSWIQKEGGLLKLRMLDLSNKKLKYLPPEIALFPLLNSLSLSNNELTSLPVSIIQLNQLERLHASRNRFVSLPTPIGRCYKLKLLDFSNNRLSFIPTFLNNLSQLVKLYLYGNQLKKSFSSLSNLKLLEELDLSANPSIDLYLCPTMLKKLIYLRLPKIK